jgi:Fe-S cluster assembly iron-binding protein IscA
MIEITPAARERIQAFVESGVVQDPALRIALDSSAQSPLSRAYDISLVEREDRQKTEIAINVDGIRVFLNLDTSNLLSGATVEWVEDASGFRVSDPKARAVPERPRSELALTGPLADRVQKVIDEVINPGIASHGGFVGAGGCERGDAVSADGRWVSGLCRLRGYAPAGDRADGPAGGPGNPEYRGCHGPYGGRESVLLRPGSVGWDGNEEAVAKWATASDLHRHP